MQTANGTLTIRLTGKKPDMPITSFLRVVMQTVQVLREIDSDLSLRSNPGGVWRIRDIRKLDSVISIEIYRESHLIESQIGDEVVHVYMDGLNRIDSTAVIPPHFSLGAVSRINTICKTVQNDGLKDVEYSAQGMTARPSTRIASNARQIVKNLGKYYYEGTTLEGNLESVTVHGKRQFSIYDELNGNKTICRFPEAIMDKVRACLGNRVSVNGEVKFERNGRPSVMKAVDIRAFKPEGEITPFNKMRPIDVTDGMESVEHVRRIFNGE